MKRSLRKLSAGGDTVLAEWDTESITPERIREIEHDYNQLVERGYTPTDITDGRDTFVTGEGFNPGADTLMIPRVMGG